MLAKGRRPLLQYYLYLIVDKGNARYYNYYENMKGRAPDVFMYGHWRNGFKIRAV